MDVFSEAQRYSLVFDVVISFVLLSFIFICWRYYDWDSLRKGDKKKGLLYGTFLARVNERLLFIICASPFILLDGYFVTEKLDTRIDEYGIHYKMQPTQWEEQTIGWDQINRIERIDHVMDMTRRYATYDLYSINDEYGVFIYLHDGRKVVIGTKKPDELTHAISQYRK